jgi:N-methylhydantoinase A
MSRSGRSALDLGVDIGGTFTDVALYDPVRGRLSIGKTLTTPDDPARGALAGLRALLAATGTPAPAIRRVIHGTTLVTNALIERKGSRTAYVTTAGFKDVFETGRQKRYDMYDLGLRFPEPLVPRSLRFEVSERIDAAGRVRRALDPDAAPALAARLRRAGVAAAGICLLHSYRAPEHERALAAALRAAAPEVRLSLSSEVAPEIREYPRASTTVANAYVQHLAERYLERLQAGLAALGCPAPLYVMLSHGGLATTDTAARFPIRLLESGPAGGALVGAYHAGRREGSSDVGAALAFDMGGTTAKVCLLEDGAPRLVNRFEAARVHRLKRGSGLPISVPCVDLLEVGAGGGSIARVDRMGLVQVGPQSAGADPGPACYGRGGVAPTVTDANLLLGYLDPAYFLGGTMPLDTAAARDAVRRDVAGPLGIDDLRAAWVVCAVADEHMADAVRVHVAERGKDVRTLDLIAFGGAGPLHAERVARTLGIRRVIVPYGAGAAASLGFLLAPVSFDFTWSSPRLLADLDASEVAGHYRDMERQGAALLAEAGIFPDQVSLERSCAMRYAGQGYEIDVPLPAVGPRSLSPAALLQAFEAAYSRLYGRTNPQAEVETVTWRLLARGPRPEVRLRHPQTARNGASAGTGSAESSARRGHRPAYDPATRALVPFAVYNRDDLRPGDRIAGPALIRERESTTIAGPGSAVEVDQALNLRLSLPAGAGRGVPEVG